MKKFMIFLVVFCLMAGSIVVSAENFYHKDTISPGETKIITVPQPEGEIDPGSVYFIQEFTFVPEENGTYRFLVRYEDDETRPYEIFMDVAGEYRKLPNCCEFEGKAGEIYELCFQYPTHDGRYPEFIFYVEMEGSDQIPEPTEAEQVPETDDAGSFLPSGAELLSYAAAVLVLAAIAALLIADRKQNT